MEYCSLPKNRIRFTKDESTEFGTNTLVKKLQAKIIDVVRCIQVLVTSLNGSVSFEIAGFFVNLFLLGRVRLILV